MSPDPVQFVFGGVAFDVHPDPGLAWELLAEHRLFRSGYETQPIAARVKCVVRSAPELIDDRSRTIRWDSDEGRLECGGVRARVRQLGDDLFAATAFVSPDAVGCSSLCTAVVGAIAATRGGLVFHASGIEVDGGAVLFVGPSGAGKTTSANLCEGASWFARDRAVVFPSRAGWHAAPMCGGDPIDLPQADRRVLPLRAILRVRRGAERTRVERCSESAALFVLRESLQTSARTREDEGLALDAILQLQRDVAIGEIHTVLKSRVLDVVSKWLAT